MRANTVLICSMCVALVPLFLLADAARFQVSEIGDLSIVLTGERAYAPGTLVSVQTGAGAAEIFKVEKRLDSRRMRSVPVRGGSVSGTIRPGASAETFSPLENWRAMIVTVAADRPRAFIPASPLIAVGSADDPSDAHADVSCSEASATIRIKSPVGERTVRTTCAQSGKKLSAELSAEAASFYWLSLANPYFDASVKSRLDILNASDFTKASELELGNSVVLSARPSIDGYAALLMVDPGGEITVLYPNELSDPLVRVHKVSPVEFADIRINNTKRFGIARIDLNATSVGLTHFVFVVSETRRCLGSFLPSDYHGRFLAFDRSAQLSPDEVGPGVFRSSGKRACEYLSLLDGRSWDVAQISFNVVARRGKK